MNSRAPKNPFINGSSFCIRIKGENAFVEETRRMMNEPVELILTWPAFSVRRDNPTVTIEDGMAVRPTHRDGFRGLGFSVYVRENIEAKTSERSAPPPKVKDGVPTRYRDCRWEKYTKSGWKSAE